MILHSIPTIDEHDIEAVVSLLKSRHLEDGAVVKDLENYLAKIIGRDFAVSTANGFGAIHLSLLSLNVGKGDEVIIPSYTCSALLHPITLTGATVKIADISGNGFNSSLKEIKDQLSNNTKAIIIPHTFGFPAGEIEAISKLGPPLIEDCAQAIGGNLNGRNLGSFGTLSVFSFYASKMICGGDGGMILTDDPTLAERIRNYRSYNGVKGRKELTFNYRLTNLPASLAISQLKKLPAFLQRRKELATLYLKEIGEHPNIKTGWDDKDDSIFFRFPIGVGQRDELKAGLARHGIATGYGVLENMHPLCGLDEALFANAVQRQSEVLSLPIYPSLTNKEVSFICKTVIKLI